MIPRKLDFEDSTQRASVESTNQNTLRPDQFDFDSGPSMNYSSVTAFGSRSLQKRMMALDTLNIRQQERTGGIEFGSKDSVSFDENQLLLVTLSTIATMANGKPLDKNFYTTTRIYLENLTDEFGLPPPNVPGLLKHMDEFQKKHGILDLTYRIDDPTASKANEIDESILRNQSWAPMADVMNKVELTIPTPKIVITSSTPYKKGVAFEGDISSIQPGTGENSSIQPSQIDDTNAPQSTPIPTVPQSPQEISKPQSPTKSPKKTSKDSGKSSKSDASQSSPVPAQPTVEPASSTPPVLTQSPSSSISQQPGASGEP